LIDGQEVQIGLAILIILFVMFPSSLTFFSLANPILRLFGRNSLNILIALVQFFLQHSSLSPILLSHFSISLDKFIILFFDSLQLLDQYPVLFGLQVVIEVHVPLLELLPERFNPILHRFPVLHLFLDRAVPLGHLLSELLDGVF